MLFRLSRLLQGSFWGRISLGLSGVCILGFLLAHAYLQQKHRISQGTEALSRAWLLPPDTHARLRQGSGGTFSESLERADLLDGTPQELVSSYWILVMPQGSFRAASKTQRLFCVANRACGLYQLKEGFLLLIGPLRAYPEALSMQQALLQSGLESQVERRLVMKEDLSAQAYLPNRPRQSMP